MLVKVEHRTRNSYNHECDETSVTDVSYDAYDDKSTDTDYEEEESYDSNVEGFPICVSKVICIDISKVPSSRDQSSEALVEDTLASINVADTSKLTDSDINLDYQEKQMVADIVSSAESISFNALQNDSMK